ncbi:MAG: hypothetical protein GAK33_01415 [Burkholderia lata]|uniref:Uncharacterized protein n=1 Tax=Burkholderia lata (strain ATCC 17760 / DSM 23089 / LMG 22485 / NCIMB 9086 / R18194 / 383) TaxID=482957 RepID=A0A833PZY2_BURL3|nr:MAG: hypothetical protein GAK33_01415 [Burkholderia lata]
MHEQGATIATAPASLLHHGPPASAVMDRPAHLVAIAIVMQSAYARQTNRHAIAVQEGVETGKVRRERPAARSNPARAAVVLWCVVPPFLSRLKARAAYR